MNGKITHRLPVDLAAIDSPASRASLEKAAELLRSGGTVAFPTETVYGLGANALDPAAVEKIFVAKQRPSWDPLIVHVVNEDQLANVAVDIPDNARLLMKSFWPGPLTLLLPRNGNIPSIVTAGRPRVGVRIPRHPVAQRLIELANVPIAAPSANSFGRTSPTRAEFVLQDLEGRIDAVIDAGDATLGLESTVVDVCEDPPVLYRPGMITLQQLQLLIPELVAYRDPGIDSAAPQAAPGLGLRHYSPKARLILLEKQEDLLAQAEKLKSERETVGVMWPAKSTTNTGFLSYLWGDLNHHDQLAQRLFAGLRELDQAGATVILCPLPEEQGLGITIRDRLFRAAR
jgi:L-threonylcarbamoyladenylate synthase